MSDTKLRELERRWRKTGAVDDEAAYLLERVRVGDLTQERLELAAYCGHEGANKAIGSPRHPEMNSANRDWTEALMDWGSEVVMRAAIAAVEPACGQFDALLPNDGRCRVALEKARSWCDSPTTAACEAALTASRSAMEAARELHRSDDAAVQRAYYAAESTALLSRSCFILGTGHGKRECPKDLVLAVQYAEGRIGHRRETGGLSSIPPMVARSLVDWALV